MKKTLLDDIVKWFILFIFTAAVIISIISVIQFFLNINKDIEEIEVKLDNIEANDSIKEIDDKVSVIDFSEYKPVDDVCEWLVG